MNRCVPDWNMEDESRLSRDNLPAANQKKSAGPDHELVELLWRNGHVIMHSQTHRKSPSPISEFNQCPKPESVLKCGGSFGNSSNSIQEDETTSWLQYPLDDPLEKGFCSDFFYEMPTADAIDTDKLNKDIITEERTAFTESASERTNVHFQENTMPPPKSQVIGFTSQAPSLGNGAINFSHFSRPMKANAESLNRQFGDKGSGNGIQVEVEESSSMVTLGSSICGSNQVQNLVDMSHTLRNDATGVLGKGVKGGVQMKLSNERVRTDTYEATVTSSSGGSGCSFGRTGQQSASSQSHKRKGRDAEESECHSEEAEYESVKANKPAQRSTSTRRSRAAEVHNLSERRRRDRINEKMKALQELIPHCNKSDKASMLDEAIEYLKSLQLQVQLMWMGSGMAPMMFPGVQHYMSQMGMGMGHAPMPSIPGLVQSIPSVSTANRTPMCPSPTLNPLNFPNQMQNAHLPESYARYLGFQHLPPTPQAMNLYTYGSHMVQQNQTAEQTSNSCLPTDGGVPSENIQYGKSG